MSCLELFTLNLLSCARLDPGLATFIASGKLGDAFGHEAIMAIANPTAHFLIKVLETFKYRPDSELDNLANTQKDPFPNQLLMASMRSILKLARLTDLIL